MNTGNPGLSFQHTKLSEVSIPDDDAGEVLIVGEREELLLICNISRESLRKFLVALDKHISTLVPGQQGKTEILHEGYRYVFEVWRNESGGQQFVSALGRPYDEFDDEGDVYSNNIEFNDLHLDDWKALVRFI